jgi:lytic murein transglycosylase
MTGPVTGFVAVALLAMMLAGQPAQAACERGSFSRWLDDFRHEAAAQGISAKTLAALDEVHFDQSVIDADRRQAVFAQSFLQFSDRMVADYRLAGGRQRLKKYRSTFERIEKDFGVPGAVVVAFWGLETDFGANLGNKRTLQSLATLAYDCRRPELFRAELLAALRILERGDLAPADMVGAWAGEIGQMQFVPSGYLELAVDYDGDGRRNLVRSVPDVLASTANLLRSHGWQAGQPWLEEVRVPGELPWAEADLAIRHPRSQWAQWGVMYADGRPLPGDGLSASLLLPMGRLGPAFLAYPNFGVYTQWNKSLVYATTAAYYATRLAGAPKARRGTAAALDIGQVKDLQRRLEKLGFDVGGVDGTVGAQTRAAVKQVQIKLGLPADSWPTAQLLDAVRRM